LPDDVRPVKLSIRLKPSVVRWLKASHANLDRARAMLELLAAEAPDGDGKP
jgi:hypothetical protein